MSDKIDKEKLNEILRQKLGNLDKIEEKAMFLRQPPSSLNNQSTSTNVETGNQNQSSSSDNKDDKK